MMIDEHGPWTAAAFRTGDDPRTSAQHGVADGGGSLCGLPEGEIRTFRNPFYGDQPRDCPGCAAGLAEAAAGASHGD